MHYEKDLYEANLVVTQDFSLPKALETVFQNVNEVCVTSRMSPII